MSDPSNITLDMMRKVTAALQKNCIPPKEDWTRAREVSAQRASKIRKRGAPVKFSHYTVNGKARYLWTEPYYLMMMTHENYKKYGPDLLRMAPVKDRTFRIGVEG